MKTHWTIRLVFLAFAVVLLLAIPGTSHAGLLTGTVKNTSAVGVANVKVEFTETATGNPVVVVGNLTDVNGNYAVSVPDGVYDVEYVTPVVTGGVVPQQFLATSVVGTVIKNVTCPFGKVLSGTVVDTLGAPVELADLNVVDAVTGALYFTPNDNTDLSGFYSVIIDPGVRNLVFRPPAGTRLAATQLIDVSISKDTTVNVAFPAGVFVSGRVTDASNQPVKGVDLDFDDVPTGLRYITPGDNTDNNGDYIVTVPIGVYDITVEPRVADLLIAQRIFSIPVNKDTVIDWVVQSGWSLSGTVTGPGGVVENCDIDIVDPVTLEKRVTPGDKTDVTGFYEVVVPTGTFNVHFQPPVATHLISQVIPNVPISADAVVDANLVTGVVLDGTVQSPTGALVKNVDLDIFDAVTKATVLVANDKTDVFGNYAIVLPAGNYDFEFEAPKSRRLIPQKSLGVSVPTDMTLPIVLDTGLSVSGIITGGGSPMDSVDVDAIIDATGINTFQPGDLSDPLGAYEIIIDFVPHTVAFFPPVSTGRAAKAFPGQNPGTDLVLNVTLDAGLGVTGHVTDPGALPFAGVTLRVENGATWVPTSSGITDISGNYETILPAGTYTFKFIPPPGSGLDTLVQSNVNVSSATVVDAAFSGPNQTPTLAAIGARFIRAEHNLNFTVSATDDGVPSPLALSVSGLPTNATFTDLNDGTGVFDFNPTIDQMGDHIVIFIASDGERADSETVTITVTDPTCDCPFQGDMNGDGSYNSTDLNLAILVYFFNGANPQDPLCPVARADFNGDGSSNSTDLNKIIKQLFFNGPPPPNPCGP